MSILVVRPDRLGDVILSTPVFEAIKKYEPRVRVTALLREAVAPVIRGLQTVDEVIIFEPDGRHRGWRGFFRLVSDLRGGKFQTAIVLQSHRKIAAALWFARIPNRVGPFSKLHTYLFYNQGIRQRRSRVEMHEADYNLQLLGKIGITVPKSREIGTRVHLAESDREKARAWLNAQGWTKGPLVAVHPGMGGSALNWPEGNYVGLIRGLLDDGVAVVVTGGPAEAELLARVGKAAGELKNQRPMIFAAQGPVNELAGIFSCASIVIAPSTGPLHLAVALGKPVLSFYPPIRVQSVERWGPYVNSARVMVPSVKCPAVFDCLGESCTYFPCMKSLTVGQALNEAGGLLKKGSNG